jgi:hypothetical protein
VIIHRIASALCFLISTNIVREKNVITPPTTRNGVVVEMPNILASWLLNTKIPSPEISVETAFDFVALIDVSILFSFYV